MWALQLVVVWRHPLYVSVCCLHSLLLNAIILPAIGSLLRFPALLTCLYPNCLSDQVEEHEWKKGRRLVYLETKHWTIIKFIANSFLLALCPLLLANSLAMAWLLSFCHTTTELPTTPTNHHRCTARRSHAMLLVACDPMLGLREGSSYRTICIHNSHSCFWAMIHPDQFLTSFIVSYCWACRSTVPNGGCLMVCRGIFICINVVFEPRSTISSSSSSSSQYKEHFIISCRKAHVECRELHLNIVLLIYIYYQTITLLWSRGLFIS